MENFGNYCCIMPSFVFDKVSEVQYQLFLLLSFINQIISYFSEKDSLLHLTRSYNN